VVHLIAASDGNFPSDMALTTPEGLEDERREPQSFTSPVHEGRVLRPAGRFLHRPRRVPLRPRVKELEEKHRHVGLVAQAYRR
jgi:hypothetical protein